MIKPSNKMLSVRKQCDILQVPRSSLYYQPIPERPENVKMMHIMDRHLLTHPTEGVVSMVDMLRDMGYPIGPKRIRRLFKLMGYQTLLSSKEPYQNGVKRVYKALFTARIKDHPCQSGMVYGYYIHPNGQRLYVYDSHY